MLEAFKKAKVVYFTTFSKEGEEHSRLMTNFNDDPYMIMWFPTERKTRKVEEITKNPRVLITFPGLRIGEYFEIEGRAKLEEQNIVEEKWTWWYLYWHTKQRKRFWFPAARKHSNRAIINVHPVSSKIVKKF